MKHPDFIPAYLKFSSDVLAEKVRTAEAVSKTANSARANAGPRGNRDFAEQETCRLFRAGGPHFGKEQPLVGQYGSGTIFFGYCNLGCIFCQNYEISHLGQGSEMSVERLAEAMLELQGMGCHNINLVTPTHQMPMILSISFDSGAPGPKYPDRV